jgi:hypothetical protein
LWRGLLIHLTWLSFWTVAPGVAPGCMIDDRSPGLTVAMWSVVESFPAVSVAPGALSLAVVCGLAA